MSEPSKEAKTTEWHVERWAGDHWVKTTTGSAYAEILRAAEHDTGDPTRIVSSDGQIFIVKPNGGGTEEVVTK